MSEPTTPDTFTHRTVPALGRRVHRLGMAASYGISEEGIRAGFERGMQYVFWNPTARKLTKVLRSLPPSERQKLVIATGPSFGYFPGSLRRRVERVLKLLGMERLDVLQLFWLGRMSAFTEAIGEEIGKLRAEGKIGIAGTSIHDRERAGRLAEDSALDLLMIRYNAAHPGAERDIFPHLARRRPAVVAYTATAWRKLLSPPRGWAGEVPDAGDCYRFCLTSPHVDVVLTGPSSEAQLDANLRALERGPLSPDEESELRRYGALVHG